MPSCTWFTIPTPIARLLTLIVAKATYVFDLGYYDYAWWARLDAAECCHPPEEEYPADGAKPVAAGGAILCDLGRCRPANPQLFQKKVREIQVRMTAYSHQRSAGAGAGDRRPLQALFFRWVKQTLKIGTFWASRRTPCADRRGIAFLLLRLAQRMQKAVTSPLQFARLVNQSDAFAQLRGCQERLALEQGVLI